MNEYASMLMKRISASIYIAACIYEIVKLFLLMMQPAESISTSFYSYTALAALCVPVLLWFILLLNEAVFHGLLYTAVIYKFLCISAEISYIFHSRFSILTAQSGLGSHRMVFSKEIFLFLTVDIALLCYSYTRGKTYYADNTNSER